MKKQSKQNPKPKAKPVAKPLAKQKEIKVLGPTLFEKFEIFVSKHEKRFMWGMLGFSIICSILLFDMKVSIGGDDSAYIERAYNFLHDGIYPYYQGPGYPLVLASLMKIFGFKIGVFKLFSLLFYTAHILLTWVTFRKKLPYFILVFMVGFAVVSDYMQYYASQTWSEAFYMFIQAVVLWLIMKVVSIEKYESSVWGDLKKRWYIWLGIGLAFTFLTMTKTVAIFGIVAPLLYFIIQKKYRFTLYILISFVLIKVGVGQLEKSLYGPNSSNQWEQMMLKDAYKPDQGTLDAAGFIGRFGENLKTYSSMHFFRFLHIIPQDRYKLSEDGATINDEKQLAWVVTIFITALILYSSFRIYKENKQVFFLVLYTLVMCGGIFFGIHANNRQDRLIIILFPFLLMIIGYGGYLIVKKIGMLQGLVGAVLGVILLASFYHTLAKAPESLTVLQKNLGSEPYYGYTQDWVNYVEMGEWCAENLPAGSVVACRKPTISFVTTHKKMWYGVYVIDSQDGDVWRKKFKEAGVTHLLEADIRAIPTKKTNRLISTMHKIHAFIEYKIRRYLKLVKVIGTDESARLYEMDYGGL